MKRQKKKVEHCQDSYLDLSFATLPDTRTALPLRRLVWSLKRYVWHISITGIFKFASRRLSSTKFGKRVLKEKAKPNAISNSISSMNLQPGDWVEVRSVKEIFATLDSQGKLKGLRFNPEMTKFCGKRFRVFKRLDKIILESTGELRRVRTPTVLLEDVFCDGQAHGGCDRSCFCFWREAWVKRVEPTKHVD